MSPCTQKKYALILGTAFAITILGGLLFCTMSKPDILPDMLLVQGQPIDPECISDLVQGDAKNTDLTQCGIAKTDAENIVTATAISAQEMAKNHALPHSFGNTYQCADNNSYCGFFTYGYIGMIDDKAVLLTNSSGGGSGVFSSVITVQRQSDILHLDNVIAGGDRCNNGILEASITDNTVRYTSYLTAFRLFALFSPDTQATNRFEDLPDCAACCNAKIVMNDQTPMHLTLQADSFISDDSDSATVKCFNTAIRDQIAAHGSDLSADQARILMQNISNTCSQTE